MNTMHRERTGFTTDEDERPAAVEQTFGDANVDATSGDDAGETSGKKTGDSSSRSESGEEEDPNGGTL